LSLDQRSAQPAAGTSEPLEALAHAGVVVTLASSAALETVVVGEDVLSDVSSGVQHVHSLQQRGAASSASVVLHHQKVLLSLVAVSSEGHVHGDNVVGEVEPLAVHMDAIDDSIGEVQEGRLDVGGHGGGAGGVNLNRDGGEGLVEARLEGQGEGSASLRSLSGEGDSLGLVLGIVQLVLATVHHVVTVRAHALGAVHITELRVAHAAAHLGVVEALVGEGLLELGELEVLVGELGGAEGELVDVFAGAVSGAVIGARSALAALAFVAVKALALARVAVAKSLASTLGVSVASVVVVLSLGVVHPGDLEGADSVGAITGVVGHTQAPVVVTDTEAAFTLTVTTARVVTARRRTCDQSKRESSREFHFKRADESIL
jgi:hypothetical protein